MKLLNKKRLTDAELVAIAATVGDSASEEELPLESDLLEYEIIHADTPWEFGSLYRNFPAVAISAGS